MIIGPGKSGKTTLAAWLEDSSDIRRVQNMVYRKNTLDTPGAYLESPWMHHHLIAAAQDASCVVMTADAKGKREVVSIRDLQKPSAFLSSEWSHAATSQRETTKERYAS